MLKRSNLSYLFYVLQLPRKRRRRNAKARKIAARYVKRKDLIRPATGPVLVVGTLDQVSGLGRSYRYEIERLAERHSELGLIDIEKDTPETVAAKIASGALPRPATVVLLCQPDAYRRAMRLFPPDFIADAWRIGYWVWEVQKIPQVWRYACNVVHELWTPTTFSAGLLASETGLSIEVKPYAVQVADVPAMDRRRFGVPESAFLGMAIMDLRGCPDRKNPIAHVKAWKLAFGNDPARHLVMKTRFSERTMRVRDCLLKEIGDAGNIQLVEALFSDEEITSFQRMADVYLSLHRSEGYGLNIHECLEMGIPAIATGWSGNMDFMHRYAHAHTVPYKLIPYEDYLHTYEGSGLEWADADIDAAADSLRSVAEAWAAERRDGREHRGVGR